MCAATPPVGEEHAEVAEKENSEPEQANSAVRPRTELQLWTPERLRALHLGACHESARKIAASIGQDGSFAKMLEKANDHCEGCILGKGQVRHPRSSQPGHPHQAQHFNDRISMDYIIKFGGWTVLVILDDYSRYIRAECLRHRDKETSLMAYRRIWEADFHNPRRLRHDNDGGFVDIDAYLGSLGVHVEPVPPYCPELDGQNERSHRTLMEMFRATVAHAGMKMNDSLRKLIMENHVCDVYNHTCHSMTHAAPVLLAFGMPAALEQVAQYYPGRPVVVRPADWQERKGNARWEPATVIAKIHANMVVVNREDGRQLRLPVGRVKLQNYRTAAIRAGMERQVAPSVGAVTAADPPWFVQGAAPRAPAAPCSLTLATLAIALFPVPHM